jgi:hypothetical protein
MGQCLKIMKFEDGGLAEIVNVWLDITKGRDFPAGSVVVLAAASHLNLHGVNGYVPDLAVEFSRIEKKFGGEVYLLPWGSTSGWGGQLIPFLSSIFLSWKGG